MDESAGAHRLSAAHLSSNFRSGIAVFISFPSAPRTLRGPTQERGSDEQIQETGSDRCGIGGGQAAEQNEKADGETADDQGSDGDGEQNDAAEASQSGGQHEASDGDGESPNR